MNDIDLTKTQTGEYKDNNVLVINVGIADLVNEPGHTIESRLRKVRGQFRRVVPKTTRLLVFSNANKADVSIETIIRL